MRKTIIKNSIMAAIILFTYGISILMTTFLHFENYYDAMTVLLLAYIAIIFVNSKMR